MRYVIRRLFQSLIVVFGVSVVAFGMLFMTGDPNPRSRTGEAAPTHTAGGRVAKPG